MQIDGRTRVIPHLACPAAHLQTPQRFNARACGQGLNAVVVPWEIAPQNLSSAVASLRAVSTVPGMIVTIPHKEAAADLCDELVGVAADLRVVNVIRKTVEGRLIGAAFDGVGFVAGLLAEGVDPAGRSVLLLGAGGAATAVADALAGCGTARLVIANRTHDKAERLAALVARRNPDTSVTVGEAHATGFDLVVNATSVGLDGDPRIPLDHKTIAAGTIVAEVIMKPAITPLLAAAAERGARLHSGHHMLDAQIDLFIAFILGESADAACLAHHQMEFKAT